MSGWFGMPKQKALEIKLKNKIGGKLEIKVRQMSDK